tara:strand:- start:73 stop:930 length:858 start_codon:yes stop_codon:yes gene_type:complete
MGTTQSAPESEENSTDAATTIQDENNDNNDNNDNIEDNDPEDEELDYLISAAKNEGVQQISLALRSFLTKTEITQQGALSKFAMALSELATKYRQSGLKMIPIHNFGLLGTTQSLHDILSMLLLDSNGKKFSSKTKVLVANVFQAIGQISKLDGQMKFMLDVCVIAKIVAVLKTLITTRKKKEALKKITLPLFWGVNCLYFLTMNGSASNNKQSVKALLDVGGLNLISKLKVIVDTDANLSIHVELVEMILFVGSRTEREQARIEKNSANRQLHLHERAHFAGAQ